MSSMKPSDACTVNDNGPRGASRGGAPHVPLKVALGAIAVVIVFVAGFAVLRQPGGQVGGVAAPTATPSPTPVPPTLPDGSLRAGAYLGEVLPTDPMRWTVTVPAGWSGYQGLGGGRPRGPQ